MGRGAPGQARRASAWIGGFAAAWLALGSAAAATAPATIRDAAPGWAREADDPATDGWVSETLGAEAGARLQEIRTLLLADEPPSASALAPFVATGFRCSDLRPERRERLFADGGLTVHRASVDASRPASLPHEGASGLARALAELRRSWGHGAPRILLKPVGITVIDPATFETALRVEVAVVGAASVVQQTARWLVRWDKPRTDEPPRLRSIEVLRHEEISVDGPPRYEDVTARALAAEPSFAAQLLVGHEAWMRRLEAARGIDNYGHHGLALGDVDGDGREDLYVCQTGGLPNRLLLHGDDGTARDAATQAGVDFLDRSHAALLLDLDNDGDQDLVVATAPALLVLANDGHGRFSRAAELPSSAAFSLAAADYDLDGDLDLYACNYASPAEWQRAGGLGLQPIPYQDARNGPPNALYRNEGELRFSDVTAQAGLDAGNDRWSFAAAWEDYDDDGDPDLYVANDYGRNNLYRNDGGRFVDVAAAAGVEDAASGMSAAWGDADGDGRLDLYVANMFSSAGNRITYQRAFQPGADDATRADLQRFAKGNTLFLNNGDGSFRDASDVAGVTMGRWAWGSIFADMNNDGLEDLVVGNGFITNHDPGDL